MGKTGRHGRKPEIMYKYLLFLIIIVCFGCRRLPNVQGSGEAVLQGVWGQDSIGSSDKLNYNLHHFKFTCDSFYLQITTHAKVNYFSDSCSNQGLYKEFAKGNYRVFKDTLRLDGTYTKANYKQKISGCFNIGRYLQVFLIKKIEKNKLLLQNIGNNNESSLNLLEPVICTPKSL